MPNENETKKIIATLYNHNADECDGIVTLIVPKDWNDEKIEEYIFQNYSRQFDEDYILNYEVKTYEEFKNEVIDEGYGNEIIILTTDFEDSDFKEVK